MTTAPPFPIRWIPSPHHYRGRAGVELDALVMHYDVVRREPGEVTTGRVFRGSQEKSAHFGIGRGAGVAQYVDVDDGAFHAGDGGDSRMPTSEQIRAAIADDSRFVPIGEVPRAPRFMNRRSVGIEQSNRGWAPRGPNPYVRARHRNPACPSETWETWTEPQLVAALELAKWLRAIRPSIWLITGHEDVCHADTLGDITETPEVERKIGGKTDPGPLYPWQAFIAAGFTRVYYDFTRHGWVIDDGGIAK